MWAPLKGVRRIYQQAFIDTYSAVGFAKLFISKHPINSADLLNDRVILFFDEYEILLLRILTDRGTEFCGKPDTHEYQLFLAINDIDHSKTIHHVQSLDDHLISEFFSRKVFALLLGEELISEQMVEKIAGWRHSGFNVHSQFRAEMIRKVYEVDPLVCPQCGGQMKVISFITDYAVVDRIIHHPKLTFVADKPPPPHLVYQELLMDSETGAKYFS